MSDDADAFDAEDVWQFPESLLIHYLLRAAETPITSIAERTTTDGVRSEPPRMG